eukprot:SAG31_NODE_5169_length_2702_cov_1.711103_4_plen_87_part_00
MALPPVSGLGVWWSRHWGNPHNIPWGGSYFGPMTEANILNEVTQPYEDKGLPLHVLVMDMEVPHLFPHASICAYAVVVCLFCCAGI